MDMGDYLYRSSFGRSQSLVKNLTVKGDWLEQGLEILSYLKIRQCS